MGHRKLRSGIGHPDFVYSLYKLNNEAYIDD